MFERKNASILLRISTSGLLWTTVVAAVGVGLVVTTPASIPARWGSVVLALAVFGLVHLLDIPLTWLQARFIIQTPTWSVRTWSIVRRWYGPGRSIRTTDDRIGTVIDWADEDTDQIWVLIRNQPTGSDPANAHATTAWRPLTDLSPRG